MLRSAQGIVVDAAVLSDPGRDPEKQVNEDAVALSETSFGVAAIVCDGMGGHERGELASRTAVERILEVLRGPEQSLERMLSGAIERAHADVYALGGNAPVDARPGSTAVVLALAGREVVVAHVGDSRAYRVRARHLERLTRDHSVVEALLAAGAITTEQANQHPDANRITRALGIAPEIDPEVSAPLRVETGDIFVLCSDGLSDLVSDSEIGEIATSSASPEACCEALVALANQRGGHDNISVAVLRVLAVGAPRRSGETQGLTPTPALASAETQSSPTAADQQTLVEQPGFTVVMGSRDGVARTVQYQPDGARNTSPTLVDPMIAAERLAKTVPGAAPVPSPPLGAPPAPHAAQPPHAVHPAPPAQPFELHNASQRTTLDAVPSMRPPRAVDVRLLLWGTVALCAVILALVVGWWLLRG